MPQQATWGETLAVKLDVGFLTDIFKLDSSTLDGTDKIEGTTDFVDITQYVQSININRGRNSQLDPFNPGTLNITADDRASRSASSSRAALQGLPKPTPRWRKWRR